MNKKLIAMAVAGALGAPGVALAQASSVQIYGTLWLDYSPYYDAGANKPKTDMFSSQATNLGFKGEENLGGGLMAWFQCESTMNVTGSSAAAGAAAWCGRNSAFGLKGGFGNVYFGNWDTPFKLAHGTFRAGFSTSGPYGLGLMWNDAQSNINNAGTSFTRRQQNLLSYATPNISGFEGRIAYSAANEATVSTSASTATKPRLYSLAATYTNGPLILSGGWEKHTNYNPAAQTNYTGGSDRGTQLAAAYTFAGKLKASLIYTNLRYELAAGRDLQQTNWGAFANWEIQGPHRIRAGYIRAGDTSGSLGTAAVPVAVNGVVGNAGAGNTSGQHYALQYVYQFSKRTELNFGYARVNNSSASIYRLQTMGVRNTGQDQSAWAIGTIHKF